MGFLGQFSLLFGLLVFLSEADERRTAAEQKAWEVINRARADQPASAGRIDALQSLNRGCVNNSSPEQQERNALQSAWIQLSFTKALSPRCVSLRGLSVRGAHLPEIELMNADLRNAELQRTGLWSANLKKANLRGAVLEQAKLRDANLKETNLSMANLAQADLTNADLTESDLTDAQLKDADLRGANLMHAIGLTPEQVKQARNWHHAQYDPAFQARLNEPQESNKLQSGNESQGSSESQSGNESQGSNESQE